MAPAPIPPVGTVRGWLGLEDFNGRLFRKDYTLRAVGAKIEVWVASGTDATSTGTAFPAGDCRNAVPGTTDVNDAQAQELANQFDSNIFPREAAAFSTPPDRDGTGATISGDFTGSGDKIVTLVDNVRDDNFPAATTCLAGFFSSQFNELLDRNVMTIDAFDWLHRTGANPTDEPTADMCTSRPSRPFLYEGEFAHEYQHLLQYYTDASEATFVNEGLSDFAISLTGYADSTASVFEPRVGEPPVASVTTKSLDAARNLDNPSSYAIPGAAPNGADYGKLRDAKSASIGGKRLRSLSFTGATSLAPQPLKWTVVADAPGNEGNPTLWSGNVSNLDSAAIAEVTVPAGNPTLTFNERHLAEATFDYAYTVVSTDGREDVHRAGERQHGGGTVRAGSERRLARVRDPELRPLGVRRTDDLGRFPLRQ